MIWIVVFIIGIACGLSVPRRSATAYALLLLGGVALAIGAGLAMFASYDPNQFWGLFALRLDPKVDTVFLPLVAGGYMALVGGVLTLARALIHGSRVTR